MNSPSTALAYVTVHGGPDVSPVEGQDLYWTVGDVNNFGVVVASLTTRTYDIEGEMIDEDLAYRWDGSGNAATLLGHLGVDVSGNSHTVVSDLNDAGIAVGYSQKFDAQGHSAGTAAVRWDPHSAAPIELQSVAPDSNGNTFGGAISINSPGVIAGSVDKGGPFAVDSVHRAVQWNTFGQINREFEPPSDYPAESFTNVYQLNDQGWALGFAGRPVGGEIQIRPVRWDSANPNGSVLGDLGVDEFGETYINASSINSDGTTVGVAMNFLSGQRNVSAVRWNANGTAATALDSISQTSQYSWAHAINDAGMAVGESDESTPENAGYAFAVRWDAGGTAATRLGSLDLPSSISPSIAVDVNNSGIAIGVIYTLDETYTLVAQHAVYWDYNGTAVDLNSLIAPNSNWNLTSVKSISDSGWIVGLGMYDPDGAGAIAAYERPFVLQLPSVPGDYDGNLIVDPNDYLVWRKTFGSTKDRAADGNGDGIVNAADYTVWRDNLGADFFGAASTIGTAVPESNTLLLSVIVFATTLAWPRLTLRPCT